MKNYRAYVMPFFVLSLCANVFFLCALVNVRVNSEEEFDVWGEMPVELKQRQTVMVIDSLLLQVNLYKYLTGETPESVNLLRAPLDGDGPNWPLDRFGKKLEYKASANEVVLVSAGVDGVFETEDDIVGCLSSNGLSRTIESPIGNWSAEILCCELEDDLNDDSTAK